MRNYIKYIGICVLLLSFVLIPSSAEQALIHGKYRIAYSDTVVSTAYNSMESQCDSTPWITASGTRCREGVVAANHLPIGTKLVIDGFGGQIFTVEDRMNRRYNRRIDIWFRSYSDAMRFGKRKIRYHVLESV
ncbi:MAG: 3D domain-containing protein [Candidatus Margulisiibacteriota bacterium]